MGTSVKVSMFLRDLRDYDDNTLLQLLMHIARFRVTKEELIMYTVYKVTTMCINVLINFVI